MLDTEGKTVLISGLFPEGSVKASAHLPDSVPCTGSLVSAFLQLVTCILCKNWFCLTRCLIEHGA